MNDWNAPFERPERTVCDDIGALLVELCGTDRVASITNRNDSVKIMELCRLHRNGLHQKNGLRKVVDKFAVSVFICKFVTK